MKKRFRGKRKIKKSALLIFVFFSTLLLTYMLLKYRIIDNKLALNNAVNNVDNYLKIGIKIPVNKDFLVNYAFNIDRDNYQYEPESLGEYIDDFGHNDTDNTIDIYLYNTHQTENYSYERVNEYNVTETVLLASYMLREKLKDYNLNAYVETSNISNILREHNWKYKYSYDASRILINNFLKDHNPDLIIDIHRDSSSYDKTTINYNDLSYARVLFVVGKEHDNYQTNLALAEELNELIKKEIPNLSRGISIKEGKGVNGIYNQDISPRMVLLEIGGQYNNIGEVNNTLDIISKVLKEHFNERKEKE